jgi:hypothetical protein
MPREPRIKLPESAEQRRERRGLELIGGLLAPLIGAAIAWHALAAYRRDGWSAWVVYQNIRTWWVFEALTGLAFIAVGLLVLALRLRER